MGAAASLAIAFPASDVDYHCHYTPRLAPEWLDAVALINGVAPPARGGPLRICELGCGRGVSTTVHAALRPAHRFTGIDLMPSHVDFARRLAAAAGAANASFVAADFADFGASGGGDAAGGPFDYIVAHGVYSWIDAAGVAALHGFIDRHLAPGGLVYLSYNAMPGWARDLPLQHMVRTLAARETGPSDRRVLAAGATVRTLLDAGAGALRHSPAANAWGEGARPSYLAHEYLSAGWRALWVDEVQAALGRIGLAPAGRAVIVENFDTLLLKRDQRAALAAFGDDPVLRALVRDVLVNQRFRCDVYARGAAPLGAVAQRERLLDTRFALLTPAALLDYAFETPAGRVAIDNPATRAIVGRLAAGPARLGDCGGDGVAPGDLVAGALSLFAGELIAPATAADADPARLNAALRAMTRDADGSGLVALASGTALWFSGRFPPIADEARSAEGEQWVDFLRSRAPGAVVTGGETMAGQR